jgi:hypothetical protein
MRRRARGPGSVDVFSEYTGLDRFPDPAYASHLRALYEEKYARRQVDLLLVVGPSALDFVLTQRFLEGVPVVTCYVPQRLVDAARAQRPEVTGALPAQNAPKTLELMLTIYPRERTER